MPCKHIKQKTIFCDGNINVSTEGVLVKSGNIYSIKMRIIDNEWYCYYMLCNSVTLRVYLLYTKKEVIFERVAVTSRTDIHGLLRMNSNHFSDPLTFHLVPPVVYCSYWK